MATPDGRDVEIRRVARSEGLTGRSRVAASLREVWTWLAALLAVASAVTQLLVSGQSSRLILLAIAGAAVLFLSFRIGSLYPHPRIARLQTMIARQDRQIRQYRAAIDRLIDRQVAQFTERVEITVTIGATPNEDRVDERHIMTPKPFISYRVITPITAVDGPRVSFEELEFSCETSRKDTAILVLPLKETRRGITVLVLFQPGLNVETEWTVHYKAPRVWAPLRLEGADFLAWSARNLDGEDLPVPVTHLTLKVVFPSGSRGTAVRERQQRGSIGEEQLSSGAKCITWADVEPRGVRYEWDIVMSPDPR